VKIKTAKIKELQSVNELSQNEMAHQIGVSKGTLSNALAGKRGVGRKTLVGLLKLFPEESVASLTEEMEGLY
jgi:transcriptional regulator with XRE-family HTH domain